MRHVIRLMLTVGLIAVVAAAGFAGGQGEAGGSGSGASESNNAITMWHFPQITNVPGHSAESSEFGDWWQYVAQRYMQENPGTNVTIEMVPWEGGVDKINVAIAGGSPPDIVFDYLGRTGGWAIQGASVPLEGIVSEELQSDIVPAFKDLYMINGSLHALPGFSWNQNLNINVGLLRSLGYQGEILNGPGQPYTYEEFEQFLKDIKAVMPTGVYPLGLGAGSEQGDYLWWSFFWGFGGFLYDQNGQVTDDSTGIVAGYEYLKSLADQDLLAPGVAGMTASDVINLWTAGRVAILGGSQYHARLIENAIDDGVLGFEYDVMPVPMPTLDGDSGYAVIGPTGFSVMAQDPEKQQAAVDFIEYAMKPEIWGPTVVGSGQFPATQSAAAMDLYAGNEYQAVVQSMLDRFPAGNFALSSPNYNKIRIALSTAGQGIFSGQQSIEDAVAVFLEEAARLEQ